MNKLSLNMKLSVGFGVLLVVLTITSAVSYVSMQKLDELSASASNRADARFLAKSVNSIINDQKAEYRAFLLSGNQGR
jgi:CHASE3 domain sensor protein